jgi:hypothetical protein
MPRLVRDDAEALRATVRDEAQGIDGRADWMPSAGGEQ